MKNYFSLPLIFTILFGVVFLPQFVFAHERQVFMIDGKYYQFIVGSLNEPIAVDDKTGVDLRVELVTQEHVMEKNNDTMPHAEEKFPPVTGLDKTLHVELQAGAAKKILSLKPAYNDQGAYKANFIPTLQTTYYYRFFGTINNTPVDLLFTCSTGETGAPKEDMGKIAISDKVERMSKAGAFSCPVAKGDLGFPVSAPALNDLNAAIEHALRQAVIAGQSARSFGSAGIAIGFLGLIVAGMALIRSKRT